MKMIFENYNSRATFEDLYIGELFGFESTIIDAENPCVYLKITEDSAFDLYRNQIGNAPQNFNLYSAVRRVKGYLVVEGVD